MNYLTQSDNNYVGGSESLHGKSKYKPCVISDDKIMMEGQSRAFLFQGNGHDKQGRKSIADVSDGFDNSGFAFGYNRKL